ncbi:McrB family protein, partial [Pseudomonadota bacterium]
PPGTGKTYHTIEGAVRAADPDFVITDNRDALKAQYDALVNAKRIRFVTFHQSFGYEEFVEGLRAEANDNGQISYQVKPGIFKQICDDASRDKDNHYVLIIDEINRGNISKIFGELITLIEPSKRSGNDNNEALSVRLSYSKDTAPDFSVPDNLYIIGTMNTADRSLAMMDTALRRRFDFKEMMPNPALLQDTVVHGIHLGNVLHVINQRIEVLYDREHTLGHAFFIPVKEIMEQQGEEAAFVALQSAFKNKIIPLLEEYFFEDWHKIRLVLGDNQKKEDCQFVQEHRLNNLNDLFGPDYEPDSFGQQQSRYEINSAAFTSLQAYQGILGGTVAATPTDSTLQRAKPETEVEAA